MNSWGRENDSERERLSLPARLFIQLIKSYQLFVSPRSGPCCRYTPSCSQYAIDALRIHGAFKGLFLAVWRIMRCNPFSKGGYDPVPNKTSEKKLNLMRFFRCRKAAGLRTASFFSDFRRLPNSVRIARKQRNAAANFGFYRAEQHIMTASFPSARVKTN